MSAHPLPIVIATLATSGIEHMIAGSVASSFHGEPRSTRDVDLVIVAEQAGIERFLELLDRDRFYVAERAAREALGCQGQFNVIDTETMWKFDLMVRRDRAFSLSEFSRRRTAVVFDTTVWIASAEDTILAKLEWANESESERQRADVVSVLAVLDGELDNEYLDRWAKELGVVEALGDARRAAQ